MNQEKLGITQHNNRKLFFKKNFPCPVIVLYFTRFWIPVTVIGTQSMNIYGIRNQLIVVKSSKNVGTM